MKNFFYLVVVVLISGACATHNTDYRSYLQNRGLNTAPQRQNIQHCHGYGCRIITPVALSDKEWQQVTKIFRPKPKNAAAEREKLAKALGLIERMIGDKNGTHADIRGTFVEIGDDQLDCVDESTNTTTYIALLHAEGLLKFHEPSGPAVRLPIINAGRWPHQTAVIIETKTGIPWAVDSWFQDNGKDADIIELETWKSGWKPANVHEFL